MSAIGVHFTKSQRLPSTHQLLIPIRFLGAAFNEMVLATTSLPSNDLAAACQT